LFRKACEADHSPPSNANVKNGGAFPPPPYTVSRRGPVIIKDRDNFTLTEYRDEGTDEKKNLFPDEESEPLYGLHT
jgi:hypothetical protein